MTMMLNFTDEKRRNYNVHVNVEIEKRLYKMREKVKKRA